MCSGAKGREPMSDDEDVAAKVQRAAAQAAKAGEGASRCAPKPIIGPSGGLPSAISRTSFPVFAYLPQQVLNVTQETYLLVPSHQYNHSE